MRTLVITNATVIDGTGRAPQPHHTLVVDGRTISWLGPDAQAPVVGPDAVVVDAAGRHLLPGFIDSHVHLTLKPGLLGSAELMDLPERYGYYQAIPLLKATLNAGVTSARDLGGLDMATEMAIREGLIEGPEVVFAYRALSPTGGHGDFRTCCGFNVGQAVSPNGDIGFLCDGVDAALAKTREVMRLGAKVIKVMASGGVWSPRATPWHDGLNVSEMRAVVDEAAVHDIPVAAHAQSARSITNALRAGVRSIEHAYEIDDEAIQLMLDQRAFMVPTLSTTTAPPDPAKAPPYAVAKKLRLQESVRERVPAAIAAGVRVALGTDAGVSVHGNNLRELGLLVDFGMKPMDAILAGTRNAAELLQIDGHTGTIVMGKDADLVLTDVDPLAEIDRLADPTHIKLVVAKGRVAKNLLDPLRGAQAAALNLKGSLS